MHHHKNLDITKWRKLSLAQQLANVGSDVERTIKWRNNGRSDFAQHAFERVLELLTVTINDPKNHTASLKELTRLYELLVDYFAGNNIYKSSDQSWQKYFYAFAVIARSKN